MYIYIVKFNLQDQPNTDIYCRAFICQQALLQADIGAAASSRIIEDLRQTAKAAGRRLEPDDIKSVLRGTLIQVKLLTNLLPLRSGLHGHIPDIGGCSACSIKKSFRQSRQFSWQGHGGGLSGHLACIVPVRCPFFPALCGGAMHSRW